ncbi:serine/arginine-rich splicing factor SC35-like [Magnolia sinica]|uniref:serine/arginine-rich splicing factor SC35-like n=1 Tax=Magnolia sinica TaxID=86752 RepID=UPI002659D6E5|nr:serine/arginine-rich splicing factor SC35-like [Magnolia sinica]
MEVDERPWIPVTKKTHPPSSFSIFIGNITFDTMVEDLNWIFGAYGKLVDVFHPTDRARNRSREFSFVRFRYEQDAINAKNCLHRRRVDGRIITVERAKNQNDHSTPTLQNPNRSSRHQQNPSSSWDRSLPSPPSYLDKALNNPPLYSEKALPPLPVTQAE